jgi:hypothetical protein
MITPKIVMDSFKAVRGNTIQIARDIPADKYSFRATAETRTVLELFRDIIRITEFVVGMALHKEQVTIAERSRDEWRKVFVKTDVDALETPEQVVAALEKSIEDVYAQVMAADPNYLNETLVALDGITKVRLWMINTAKEQEMVMRSQLLLMERMLGIVPHTTRRQQELQKAKEARAAAQ